MLRGIDKVMLGLLLQDGRKITGNKCVLGLGVNRGSGRRQRERDRGNAEPRET